LRITSVSLSRANFSKNPETEPATTERFLSRKLCESLAGVFEWHVWARLALTSNSIWHSRRLEELWKLLQDRFELSHFDGVALCEQQRLSSSFSRN
jgi:hypothetical protein